jgi:GAF domain-containing protein
MWKIQSKYGSDQFYNSLEKELLALIEGEKNQVANMANISSWIYHAIPDLNWAGFYLWHESYGELVLGPFQGMPACIRIKPTRGVCGAAYSQKKVQRVDDVHTFPDHIACDSNSRSELVIPLIKNIIVFGVFDLDSPIIARFSLQDETELTRIFNKISNQIFY